MLKFSSGWYLCVQKSLYHMHSTTLLKGFSSNAFETVPPFLWLMMALPCLFKEDCWALLSMPLLQACWKQLHNPLRAVVSWGILCCPLYASLLQACWKQLHNPLRAVVSLGILCCPFYASLFHACWEQLHNPLALLVVSLGIRCCPFCAVEVSTWCTYHPKKMICAELTKFERIRHLQF